MKYKVGDRVRVKTLEKLKKELGVDGQWYARTRYFMSEEMESKCGEIVTIARVDEVDEDYRIKEDEWFWTEDMFEGLAEETVSELDIYKKAVELIEKDIGKSSVEAYINIAKTILTPILNKEEKAYLSAVIKPFKKCEVKIRKGEYDCEEYILMVIDNSITVLPYFKKCTMYKGMELYKYYTLEELGLD